ncbi:MAG: S1 RNA-binding domain-containing protein [Faecalibacterium sp.]
MMQAYRTEGNYRSAAHLSAAELRTAMAGREILQSTALAFDTQRQLRFELGGIKGVMPFSQCADGAENGSVRDIAVLTRVGRPTCFVIEGLETDAEGRPYYLLSRAEAQRMCKAEYLSTMRPGDILPCTVTHIEPFGAFCDVGCGISALLPIDCMSVSRISSPADRVSVGQQILCAIRSRDAQGRFVLTIRELLGTWAENAAAFSVGETVVGIVRSVEDYGTFIEIAPNLAGLAESCPELHPGQAVSVYIKNILPEKMKIKLVIVNHCLNQSHRFELQYFITEGHLEHWVYSTPDSRKQIETDFEGAACNSV